MRTRRFTASSIALVMSVATCGSNLFAQADMRPAKFRPVGTPLELGLAGFAKVVCSAVFVSGRDPGEAARNSGHLLMPSEAESMKATWSIDRDQKIVHISLDGITREAKFYGDQGCIIHKADRQARQIFFTPVPVTTTLPDAMSQAWPMGDRADTSPLPPELNAAKVMAAVDAAFGDPTALTAGFVVVYKGRIIAERYMPGISKDTQLESWSMGKSIVSTLFALLVKDGTYRLDQPAPVPEWQSLGDPRAKILGKARGRSRPDLRAPQDVRLLIDDPHGAMFPADHRADGLEDLGNRLVEGGGIDEDTRRRVLGGESSSCGNADSGHASAGIHGW